MQRLHLGDRRDALALAPGEEFPHAAIGATRVRVADVRDEEFEKARLRALACSLNERRCMGRDESELVHKSRDRGLRSTNSSRCSKFSPHQKLSSRRNSCLCGSALRAAREGRRVPSQEAWRRPVSSIHPCSFESHPLFLERNPCSIEKNFPVPNRRLAVPLAPMSALRRDDAAAALSCGSGGAPPLWVDLEKPPSPAKFSAAFSCGPSEILVQIRNTASLLERVRQFERGMIQPMQ
jgi:hypothetical protein